jgi:sugar phosphate isomerase/epimerase
MRLGYNTNGLAAHRPADALALLAEAGYEAVAITVDHAWLDPWSPRLADELRRMRELLARWRLVPTIETGARFLLDPRCKHQPTLLSPRPEERAHRLDFLCRAVDLAAELNADAVSFWSGSPYDEADDDVLMERLVEGCRRLCEHAQRRQVRLAFEPEPGMLIDTMPRFAELQRRVAHPLFGLTIDIGHLHCQGETPIADHLRAWRDWLWNIHIEDMRRGVHDHLMFGAGEIDFGPVLRALNEIGYAGGVHVELSRHSHDAVETARRSLAFLRQAAGEA